jgi:hypothetical protein
LTFGFELFDLVEEKREMEEAEGRGKWGRVYQKYWRMVI